MNLLAARVVLRPRSVAEVLDLAVPFCLTGWRSLARLWLASLAPVVALCFYLRLGRHWSWPAIWLLAVGLADVLEGLFTGACGELLFASDRSLRARAIAGRFLRRLPAYLGALLVTRALLALLVVLLPLFPLVAVRLLFVRQAVQLEGASALGSLARSRNLSRGHGGACLGLLLAAAAAPALFAIGGELLGDAVVNRVLQLGSPSGQLFQDGGSIYALVGFSLSVPAVAAARFLQYIDLRTRKEGWDIQLRFAAIAAAEGAGRTAA